MANFKSDKMKRTDYVKILMLPLSLCGCGGEFLDVKRDKSDVVPASIADFQAILDDAQRTMNSGSSHELSIIGAGEFYVSDETWNASPPYQRNAYIWAKEQVYEREQVPDWDYAYRRILYANTALEGIERIDPVPDQQDAWNNVKGSALFFRAFSCYQLAQLFCKPYDPQTAPDDLGIPLRLEADITLETPRATLEDTYQQVIRDLTEATELLPVTPLVKQRPSRPAACALLARTFLQMQDYDQALLYADRCLQLVDGLIDFNTVDLDRDTYATFDFLIDTNPEVLFMSYMGSILIAYYGRFNADTVLLDSYGEDDLRRQAYFRAYNNTIIFKGSYSGTGAFFSGMATDEVLLIRAECYARQGQVRLALADLNELLRHRYKKETFTPVTAADSSEALALILQERKKELVLRGTRWEDLRRLNQDERFAETLVREINGQRHELLPNDPRYVWPIPDEAVQLGGLEQNPR